MRISLCWLAVLAVACGGKKDDAPKPGSDSAPVAPPPSPVEVLVFVNDAAAANVTAAQIAGWPRLDGLLPSEARRLGMWDTVAFKGAKATTLDKPSSAYPDMVPALFPGEGGAITFGMFDTVELAKHGKPAFAAVGIKEIRITIAMGNGRGERDTGDGATADPTKLVLKIKTAAGESQLTGAQLLAIPREPTPGNEEAKGWPLTKLLDAAGVKSYSRLLLVDAAGMNLTLDKADFDDKTVIPFVKLNKQGALRFRILKKQGDGWTPSGDLRALASIEVVK
jgi:hypothetical protein